MILEAERKYEEWVEKGQCKDRPRGQRIANCGGWEYGGHYIGLFTFVYLSHFSY